MPLFKIDVSEAEITREVCLYIKYYEDLIPEDMLADMCVAMYLNIVEYIIDEKEQDKLMELIDVEGTLEGTFSQIRNEGKNEGIDKGRKEVYEDLLKTHSIDEVSEFTGKKQSEILNIINSK